MLELIEDAKIALLVIFNAGIVARIIMILQTAKDDDDMGQSVKKKIKNHVIAAIVVTLAGTLVSVISSYYL